MRHRHSTSRLFDRVRSPCYGSHPFARRRPLSARATPAVSLALRTLPHVQPSRARAAAERTRIVLAVEAVGHLVPPSELAGRVHSTFAHACNIEYGSTLITLVAAAAGNGPTLLRLRVGGAPDLRRCFDDGEPIRCRGGIAIGERATLDLTQAAVWHPAPAGTIAPGATLAARLRHAAAMLAYRRDGRCSVIDGDAAPTVSELAAACRALDTARAAQATARLIGWGEGLTPAGDDVVIGLCAGLDAMACGDPRRTALRRAVASTIGASLSRTTRISAHYLRLAAIGHYNERLLDLRSALLHVDPSRPLDEALRSACALGATSGSDMIAGLLAALRAWSPAPIEAVV